MGDEWHALGAGLQGGHLGGNGGGVELVVIVAARGQHGEGEREQEEQGETAFHRGGGLGWGDGRLRMRLCKWHGCPRRLSEAWGPMWVRTKGSCIDSQSVHPLGSLVAGIWARATVARGEGRVNGTWGTGRKRHVAECSERWGHKRGTVRLLFYVFTYCRCLYLFIYIMKCSFSFYSKPFPPIAIYLSR